MSTEVMLIGVNDIPMEGDVGPDWAGVPLAPFGVVTKIEGAGISTLARLLEGYQKSKPDVLMKPVSDDEPGVTRYLVADPDTFLNDVAGKGHDKHWDFGEHWEEVVNALATDLGMFSGIKWWFHVES